MPERNPPGKALLGLRPPTRSPLKRVRVNGQPWSDVHASHELVRLPAQARKLLIVATYGWGRTPRRGRESAIEPLSASRDPVEDVGKPPCGLAVFQIQFLYVQK